MGNLNIIVLISSHIGITELQRLDVFTIYYRLGHFGEDPRPLNLAIRLSVCKSKTI